ncbi:MAG TPA: nucleoside deaminase [Candidatus Desulfobacillus sp.]|nr:nucleoside deaminase [Candidatus Desulfobacillus sp.]
MVTEADWPYLRRCIELARQALEAGDAPFGSLLVAEDGEILFEERNRAQTVDATRHPEFEIARWAAANLAPPERAAATVYTSGEHCPMCAAAHGWAGLGRIVYASSAGQTARWLAELGVSASRVRCLPIADLVAGVTVDGPVPELAAEVRELHRLRHERS